MFILKPKKNSDVENYVKARLLNFQDIVSLKESIKNGTDCDERIIEEIKNRTVKLSSRKVVEGFFGSKTNLNKLYLNSKDSNCYDCYISVKNIDIIPEAVLKDLQVLRPEMFSNKMNAITF